MRVRCKDEVIRPVSELAEILASYVPRLITRRLARDTVTARRPTAERFAAAVLFANVSGLGPLAERLTGQGRANGGGAGGAEALSRVLNRYFGQLINLILAHGGDIVKFAGDGVLALWPVMDAAGVPIQAERSGEVEEALARMTLRAAQCGLAAQAVGTAQGQGGGEALTLRVTLDAGDISAVYIGGERNRWEFLIVGLPLIHIGEAEALTQPGDVMLCPQAWQLVRDRCSGLRLPTGAVRLQAIHAPLAPAGAGLTADARVMDASQKAMWSYIPGAIRARLEAGQSGWLAELRTVTVMLINLPDLNLTAPLALAQGIMLDVQRALYRYEGSVSKISVDDKGVTFVTALGLAPLAHKDDAVRGVQAALAIHARLRSWGLRNTIGIATGQAFCGVIGNARRREYTLIGEPVNMARRLMHLAHEAPRPAEGLPPILCDAATYQAAKSAIRFSAPSSVLFKGRTASIFVYRPLEAHEARPQATIPLIGRAEAREALQRRLQALLRGRPGEETAGGVVLIEGEAGIGKSRLTAMLLQHAEALGITTLLGRGDAVEKTTAYHAWRPVFRQLFHLDPPPSAAFAGGEADEEGRGWRDGGRGRDSGTGGGTDLRWTGAPIMGTRQAYIMAYLKRVHPRIVRLAPLLKAVLPLDVSDTYLTVHLHGEARAAHTRDLLLQLLQEAAAINPVVLILEDAQWLDAASWALARLVARAIPSLLLVVVTALLPPPWPEAYTYLRTLPETYYLRLRPLSVAETRGLIRERLGMTQVPDTVVQFVYEKTEGHPLFVEELLYTMRDAGLLHFTDGGCRLVAGAADLRALDFLNTIQGAITGRIDRLTPPQQLTLKVASIIGPTFSLRLLEAIYPLERDKPHLPASLQALLELELIVQERAGGEVPVLEVSPSEHGHPDRQRLHDPGPAGAALTATPYSFKHLIIHEVAYHLMAFAQRRQLHRAVAQWYERTYAEARAPFYPLLAHHWARAGVPAKAAGYLAQAGDQALRSGAYQEARRFFQEALTMAPALEEDAGQAPSEQDVVSRARWARLLAEADWNLGQTTASLQHLRQALQHLGQPEPTSRPRLVLDTLGQGVQCALERWGLRNPTRGQAALFEAGAAYRRLAEVYYWRHQFWESCHAGLCAVRALERVAALAVVGAPTTASAAALAHVYADVCVGSAALPWGRLSEVYKARAMAAHTAAEAPETQTTAQSARTTLGLQLRLGMYALSRAHWEEAQHALAEARHVAEQVGNWRLWGDSLTLLVLTAYYQGDLARVSTLGEELRALTARHAKLQPDTAFPQGVYSVQVQGLIHLCAGRWDAAVAALTDEVHPPEERAPGGLHAIIQQGLLASAYARRGAYAQALDTAATVEFLLAGPWPCSVFTFAGHVAVPEVYLTLWEAGEQAAEGSPRVHAARACRALGRYALAFPLGKPRAWLYQGLWAWLAGRARRARRAWRHSLAAAERLAMPYEAGLAHYELGRHLPGGDAARQEHLVYARELFTQAGASYEQQRAEVVLREERESLPKTG